MVISTVEYKSIDYQSSNQDIDIINRCELIIKQLKCLDKNNPTPEYFQLYDELKQLIKLVVSSG